MLQFQSFSKRILFAGALILWSPSVDSSVTVETQVYICYSTTAKRYHFDPNCRGLNACTHRIVKVAISDARNMGRTLCGWED